jgi:uncharacterized protein
LVRGAPRTPVRTCVGCRTARPKSALVRLAATPGGVRLDPTATLPGRGAYLCPDPTCLAAAMRRDAGALRRALRVGDREGIGTALEELHRRLTPPPGHERDVHDLAPEQAP